MGPGVLGRATAALKPQQDDRLIVGFDQSDDAGVVRLGDGTCLVQTVDFLTPIADDPFVYGAIAATNALSDVYAMGGTPVSALNVLCWPDGALPEDALAEILKGGLSKIEEAGAVLVGGHSVRDPELKYGLAVTGHVDEHCIWSNAGAAPGDALVLTKGLGTGVISTAVKRDACSQSVEDGAIESMLMLNRGARDAAAKISVHACTDVTGFGLLGHAWEMACASNVSIRLDVDRVPFLPGAEDLALAGNLPGGAASNAKHLEGHVHWGDIGDTHRDLVLDPQTSGGLLIACSMSDAATLQDSHIGVVIGEVLPGPPCLKF